MTGIRVLVCGGREYPHWERVFAELDRVHAERGISMVIHGACRVRGLLAGADRWAEAWAQANEVAYVGVPARWNVDGKSAGPKRNGRMLVEWLPDVVIGFPGGRGTADMLRRARQASKDIGTEVIEVAA